MIGTQLQAIQGEVGETAARTRESQVELESLGARSRDVKTELESLGARSRMAQTELESLGAWSRNAQAELDSLGSGLGTLLDEVREAASYSQESREAVERRLDPVTRRLEELAAALESLRTQVGAVEASSEESRTALGELPEAKADIRSVAGAVQELRAELGALPEETLEQLDAIRGDLRSLEVRLDEMATRPGLLARIGAALLFRRSPRRSAEHAIASPEATASGSTDQAASARPEASGVMFDPRLDLFERHEPQPLRLPRRYRRVEVPANPPRISIVVSSHPNPGFLDRTIRSVLEQGYEPLELIVEPSEQHRLATEIVERHRDRVAHVEVRTNGEDRQALNAGFLHASGELLSSLSPRTLLLPGSLAYVARYFERHPETDVLYGHRLLLDEDDFEIGRGVLPRHDDSILSQVNCVPPEGLFWRRGVWELMGGGVERDLRGGLDWGLMLRLREAGARIVRVPRFLAGIRVGAGDEGVVGPSNGAGGGEAANGGRAADKRVATAVRRYARRHTALQSLYQLRLLRY